MITTLPFTIYTAYTEDCRELIVSDITRNSLLVDISFDFRPIVGSTRSEGLCRK
jgi:hypothetical protein